jgi:alpha-glucosidase
LYGDFVTMGAAGFWNDMNEPSVFESPGGTMPDDVMHRLDDGSARPHPALHNVYGMQNARATFDGLRRLQPDVRPFVLTRAAYAGTQRYAATWTGDNSATWQHLAQSVPNLLSLGLSGYALAGDDIGGFIGSPSPDLLTRWYQLGAFNPLFRNHAATDTRPHEAWVDGPEHEALRRAAIEERYRLLPYLYTVAEENARTGAPIMRPVFFEFPAAKAFYTNDRDFLLGPDLLVAPAVDERLDARTFALPPGAWYDARGGTRHGGGDTITLPAAPTATPLFVRAGAIVPMQSLVQSTAQTPSGPLELHVWLPADAASPCRGTLYQDDGASLAYQRGQFLRIDYACEVTREGVTVRARVAHGAFKPWWSRTRIVVHGRNVAPVVVDGIGAWTASMRFRRN